MKIEEEFQNRFEQSCIRVSAPGRINIIGEHTDYNDGFVLPAAIDLRVNCAIGLNNSGGINAYAMDLDESASARLIDFNLDSAPGWLLYVAGVARVMRNKGHQVEGFNIVFSSDIPIGAGLSSSAAIESAVGTGLNHLFDLGLSKEEVALTGQLAEHQYVGVQCGIMDQYASVFGLEDHAILLDCRSLEKEYISMDLGGYSIVLCNSGVKHALASSEYNTRRHECEEGMIAIREKHPKLKSLRDVNKEILTGIKLDRKILKRCTYVIEENQRVIDSCYALKNGLLEAVGEFLYLSHEGLSKKYEVSCQELDFLVDSTKSMEYVAGSRMMGGGFGGCTINLVKSDFQHTFVNKLSEDYSAKFGIDLECYPVKITDGARII